MLALHPGRRAAALGALAVAAALAVPAHAATAATRASGADGPGSSSRPQVADRAVTSGKPGSIVFIRQHDAWLSAPDGSRLHRLTRDGTAGKPYQSPSQSDTGIIAVGHGNEIKVLRQDGSLVRKLDPGPLTSGVGHPLDGPPVNVAISPDGSRIAYTFAAYQCAPGAPCGAQRATAVTRTDRLTPASVWGQTQYWDPSWIGNARMIQSGGYLHQASLVDLGGGDAHWFDDVDLPEVPYGAGTDLTDFELSPDGRWLGGIRGYGDGTHVVHYRVSGNATSGPPPVVPDWLCATTFLAGLGSPTFAPDSSTMMWHEPDGLWALPSLGEPCVDPQLVVPNASQPDWSAAPVAVRNTFTTTTKARVVGTARVGTTLRVRGEWSPRPTRVGYTWLRGGTVIKGARAATYRLRPADAGARVSARLRLTAPGTTPLVVRTAPTGTVRR